MASVTGTTVNAYANALEWACDSYDKNTFIIKNTDGANALKLKVLTLTDVTGIEYPIELASGITERVLAAGDSQIVKLKYAYRLIKIAVKSNATNNHATYQVDYLGGLQR